MYLSFRHLFAFSIHARILNEIYVHRPRARDEIPRNECTMREMSFQFSRVFPFSFASPRVPSVFLNVCRNFCYLEIYKTIYKISRIAKFSPQFSRQRLLCSAGNLRRSVTLSLTFSPGLLSREKERERERTIASQNGSSVSPSRIERITRGL